MAARKVAARAGLEVTDIDNFTCCGYPMKSVDHRLALTMAARNLTLAAARDAEIVTLCNACTATLTEAAHLLSKSETFRAEVQDILKTLNLEYGKEVRVRHFTRVLFEDYGVEKIRGLMTRPLEGFRLAAHYGCHYTKPSEIYHRFEDPEKPETLDALISITGAESIDYPGKTSCCGGGILAIDEGTALAMTGGKLSAAKEEGADAIVLMCPFCSVMYDDNQRKAEARLEKTFGLPVLYLPQILGLAFGMEAKELGLNQNKVSTKELLERLSVCVK
jgi:heterodisulfide reductase subunit B